MSSNSVLQSIDFKGKSLNVATNLSPPYVYMKYNSTIGKWVLIGGTEVRLLESLSKYFNFTFEVINCNSDWGVLLPNKTWTGLIGKIIYKEAELAFAGLTVTNQRSQAVYFSHPHIITSISFITPPPKYEPILTLVIKPLEPSVWLCIISSIVLISLTEWVVSEKWTSLKIKDTNWALISALLKQQISFKLPDIGSFRLLLIVWLLASVVLTASYSGCLYSLMAVPDKIKTIDTVNQLAAAQSNGLIQVTAIGGSSYFESLKHSQFGVYQEIGKFIKPIKDKEEGLNIVRKSSKPHAYISTREHLIYGQIKYGKNSYHLPPPTEESTIALDMMAIAMHKQFEHKEKFNLFIENIKKGGFLDYWKLSENRKLMTNAPKDEDSDESVHKYKSLTLDQLQSAFYLYISGKFMCLLIFLFEIIMKNHLVIKYFSLLSRKIISCVICGRSVFNYIRN